MRFKQWLEETQQGRIIQFGQDLQLDLPKPTLFSFDFDGTLTKWNQDQRGWHEVPFLPVVRRLKDWAAKGNHCIITTHRTKELEGNPVFQDPARLKMQIKDLVQDDVLPLGNDDIFFTHMGDKGTALVQLAQKLGIAMVVHYDDEDKNLSSVANAGLIGVKVNSGIAPPKYVVAGDGQAMQQKPNLPTIPVQPKI